MNVFGIICEYNPFHNGHLYHISKARVLGADAVICVMSGNYVQRGDFALFHKSARAETAIRCGADAVIELPLPWAVSSAERFAAGGVSMLGSLGVITHICFGAEEDDCTKLFSAAELICSESFQDKVSDEYRSGISFAAARERAVKKFSGELAELFTKPNNILAIEYIKAIKNQGLSIIPTAVARTGVSHDSATKSGSFASASLLREYIRDGKSVENYIPNEVLKILSEEISLGHAPVFSEYADKAMLACLKRFSADDFRKFCDVSEGLEFRLARAISESDSLESASLSAKTKRYALSRIRRIFLNAFLDIDGSIQTKTPPYARVLALNSRGRDVLRLASKKTIIPVITKPSSVKKLDVFSRSVFELERRADDIYSLFMANPIKQGSTYTRSPYFLDSI